MKTTAPEIDNLVRANIRELKPYQSARDLVREGLLLDANENPFSRNSRGISVNRYPDPNQRVLREALGRYLGLTEQHVLAGSGSDEVLDWIFKVFCEPAQTRVAVTEPTYGMYRVMAEIFGVSVFDFPLDQNFGLKAGAFLKAVPPDVTVLFLCSPNNPTGNLLDREEILTLASEWGKIVVLDEAYIEFAATPSVCQELERHPNLILMRTFSKAFGRAGLRLGYAVANPEPISYFLKVKAPYNLSAVAQAEGLRVLEDLSDLAEDIGRILKERTRVEAALCRTAGVRYVFPSQANFLLFRCLCASQVCRKLLARGIVVRDRSSVPGLEDCVRVTIGTPEENSLFLQSLAECLEEVKP